MSSVIWNGDNRVLRGGDNIEELGHVKFEAASNRYVLWLRDLRGIFGVNDAYVRGDSFPSMSDAKQNAVSSTPAWLFHLMWLAGLRDRSPISSAQVVQALADAESGKPLTRHSRNQSSSRWYAESSALVRDLDHGMSVR